LTIYYFSSTARVCKFAANSRTDETFYTQFA
jgi:hypothetical protein